MSVERRPAWRDPTVLAPAVASFVLVASWGRSVAGVVALVVAVAIIGAVLAAVHHAEVIAARVGEPYGTLVLALSVTVIEAGLIVSVMVTRGAAVETLARDTVFATVMIVVNLVVGLCLVVGALRTGVARFNADGTNNALAALAALATLILVVPTFTTSTAGPTLSTGQLWFAAVSSLVLWLLFAFVQTIRHRDYFLPVAQGLGLSTTPADIPHELADDDGLDHAERPTAKVVWTSFWWLLLCLVAVVGLAKTLSPTLEDAVARARLPFAVVGVAIALVVLAPETLAAVRAARRGRIQTSLNLGLGSGIATIGLTLPVVAIASYWTEGQLVLGLPPLQITLLALTFLLASITLVSGRATVLQGGIHLVVFVAFVVLTLQP